MLQSFMDENTSDVTFEVKGKSERREQTSLVFHAHKVVLQFCAEGSILAHLCECCNKSTPVLVTYVDSQVFRQMMYYVSGGDIAAATWKDRSKDFIDAANRYGVKNFKIKAEAWYVKHLVITLDNAVDTIDFTRLSRTVFF